METVFNEVRLAGKPKATAQEGIAMSQALPHGLDTSITREELAAIGQSYADLPEGFTIHPRVATVAE